ncbi:MAG: hypothetical protein A3I05_04885 [Deltaproteobacteria bacterium RIFCSPLOWO2_02_FULL_44_10]|nr:MAG: hypothetical protein A3C46_00990 [Deltaproteobacteria bacterium RIFCSPHIGHO2_02_FULL_44_16]OGQ45435.1 MAG: hypothetical protein A3I05_04885 [Deltaproteobacteria bacterium RIFCSPLOWO2_02_FULL_44_10]
MKSEHRGIVAIGLSALVLIGWFTFFQPKPDPRIVEEKTPAPSPQKETQSQAQGEASVVRKEVEIAIQTATIRNDLYTAEVSNDGGVITSWKVHGHREAPDSTSSPLDLISADPSLDLQFFDANFSFPKIPRYKILAEDDASITYQWRSPEVELTKKLEFRPDRYVVDVTISLHNLTDRTLQERASLAVHGATISGGATGFLSFLKPPPSPTSEKHPTLYRDGKVERFQNTMNLSEMNEAPGALYWSGLEDRYFISSVIPRVQGTGLSAHYGASPFPEKGEKARKLFSAMTLAKKILPPKAIEEHAFSVYLGPKEINQLKTVGARLDEAIDHGWFAIVAVPILQLLKFFYGVVHNYGVAIILLTVFIKLLLHPISKKSMKSMKAMQELQPKLKELQEKYKNDKMRLNQETMLLFKRHKVNPAGGCLPMLLQLPIYVALYKVLWNSVELYHAPFFWFYKDLSAPDPYFIGPILLGIFMVLQQKLMPSASADPMQKKMMMLMPIMFSAFMLFLPSGLVIYILVNTVMSVLQQWMYNHDIRFRDLMRGRIKKA